MIQSIQYGAGEVIVRDSAGNTHVAALLQNNSFDLSPQTKGIKGSGLFDEMTAVVGMEVSIEASNAICSSGMEAAVTGGAITTGAKWLQTDAKTAAASVTVTPPSSGTFVQDCGVIDANGQPMKYNSGTPAVGEYKNAAGVYTFNAGQTGTLLIKYLYSLTSGETLTVTNQLVGLLVPVGVRVYNVSSDALGTIRKIGRYVPTASITKFSIQNKVGDFMSVDLEFKAMAALNTTAYEAYYA